MSVWLGILNELKDIRFGWHFALGQVFGALNKKAFCVNIPGFGKLNVRKGSVDSKVIRQVFRDREYDLSGFPQLDKIQLRYDELCRTGFIPVIIDAGANIGASTVWFARKFPEAKVVAVEPDASNAACIRANVAGIDNIEVVEAAIGSTPGFATIINKTDQAWAFKTARVDKNEGIRICSVNELVEAVTCGRLFIVKIDIEGFEADLFERDTDWLQQVAVLFIELHDFMLPGKGSSFNFQKTIARYNFEVLINGENMIYVKSSQ